MKALYFPEKCFVVCDGLWELRGLWDSVRFVGFSNEYVEKIVPFMWEGKPTQSECAKHTTIYTPSTFYPGMPGQSSYLKFGPRADDVSRWTYPMPQGTPIRLEQRTPLQLQSEDSCRLGQHFGDSRGRQRSRRDEGQGESKGDWARPHAEE